MWAAPYIALWLAALLVLRHGTPNPGCEAVCMVANGWLWYTVFYAALSLSAFVGAIEVVLWMLRVDRVSKARTKFPNH